MSSTGVILIVLVLVTLAGNLTQAETVNVYDFNSLNGGTNAQKIPLVGQDGWFYPSSNTRNIPWKTLSKL